MGTLGTTFALATVAGFSRPLKKTFFQAASTGDVLGKITMLVLTGWFFRVGDAVRSS